MQEVKISGQVVQVRPYEFKNQRGELIARNEIRVLDEDGDIFIFSRDKTAPEPVPQKGEQVDVLVQIYPDFTTMKPIVRTIKF